MADGPSAFANILENREVRAGLRHAVDLKLLFSNEEERLKVESLSNRALNPQSKFDRTHRLMIYALALAPDQVGWSFKLRERLHRLFRNL